MADKEATLKLTLKSDGFKAGLTDAENAAKKAGKGMGAGISKGLSDAGKAGIDALKGSLSNLKSAVMGIAGIAGGFGIVEFARRAISAEGQFRKLSFQIRAGTGEMRNWRDMQREAQATALKFGHTSEEVGKSISDLYAAVGDPKFAMEASKIVAEFATGAHEPLETMTALAGGLNEKFGVTAQELPDVLAQVVSLGNKGGLSVQDMADKIGIIGANAKGVGLEGAKGFRTMAAWLNVADNATGTLKKGIVGVQGIIEGLSGDALKKPLLEKMGIDVGKIRKAGGDFNAVVGEIMKKTGGKESNLAKVFGGDQLKVMAELGRTYAKGFEETKGDVKAQTKGGLDAFNAALEEAGKSQLDAKAIAEEAAREMETPEKKIATAMEKLAQVFTSEKMSAAFQQLAEFIPKVVETMMKHPLLTGALMSGVPQAMAGSLIKGLTETLTKGLGSFFKGGGTAAFAIGAGALGAYEGGKALIDAHFEERERQDDNTRAQGFEAMDMLTNSRTMRGSQGEFTQLATDARAKADDLQRRVDVAEHMQGIDLGKRWIKAENGGMIGGHWEEIGAGTNRRSSEDVARDYARKALPGGSEADIEEWVRSALRESMGDSRNLDTLRQGLADAQQAAANFGARAAGTYGKLDTATQIMGAAGYVAGGDRNAIGMQLHGVGEQDGIGLGGPIKTNRQRREEAAAAKEEAKKEAQKQDFAGLIDGITAPLKSTLLVRVVNPEEIGGTPKPPQGAP